MAVPLHTKRSIERLLEETSDKDDNFFFRKNFENKYVDCKGTYITLG